MQVVRIRMSLVTMDFKARFKVLAIDDEPLVRKSIVAFLEDSGFEVFEADNAREGLRVFHEQKPDVVLCDLQMPVMSGLELLSHFHQEQIHTPIIVVSGAGLLHDAVEALRLGAWDYVIKPITDLNKLEHAINQALERSCLLQENERYREALELTNQELQQNLSILKDDQEAGRCIQLQLLPPNNLHFGELVFSHHMIPSLYLSGDFIDYFSIDSQYIGFYMADVSGHGAASAFVTVLLKSLVDEYTHRYRVNSQEDAIINPGQLLQQLNQDMLQAHLGKYFTLFYGVIHRDTQQLRYSMAGHFPHPIFAVNQEARYLEGASFPIGVTKNAEFTTQTLMLPDNFSLTLFSDGVLELMPQTELADKEKYLVSMIGEHPSDISIPFFLETLGITGDQGLPDDLSVLLIKK